MQQIKKIYQFITLAIPGMLSALTVQAQTTPVTPPGGTGDLSKNLQKFGTDAGYQPTSGDLKLTIANIVRIVVGFVGIIFVVLIIVGGLTWMTSAGNEQKIEQAKKIIVNSVIGLVVTLMAFAIATFVVNSLTKAV